MCGNRSGVCGNCPIKNLVSILEIALSPIVETKIKKNVGVFRIEGGGLFEVRVRFSPFALASLNGGDRGFVRLVTLRDLKLGERATVVAIAVAVVIFRPNVFVVVRIDQLHAHPDAVATATNAAFQECAYSECFPDSRALRNDARLRDG